MVVDPLPTTLLDDRVADWLRPFTVDLGGERITRLRQSVEALREALSLLNAVDAVAYAYGDESAGERIIETVRAAARNADTAYTAAVGDAEPPALVAAALADQLAVEPDSEVSTLISMLVLSADWGGRRAAIDGIRLADYASRQLEYRSASARRLAQLTTVPSASEFVREALRSLEAAAQVLAHQTTEYRRGSELVTHADIVTELAARIDALAARADSEHAVLREQLRQQTWMLQSWCETAEASWSDVVPEARPIIAAIELAHRTLGGTPAVGAEALLASILASAGRGLGVDPIAAIAAAGPYLEDRLLAAPHRFLFPLTSELAHWRELTADRDEPRWRPSAHGVAEAWQEETAIAVQAYREALALRLLGHD
jgi:Arc/MetJ-type ribon-helix-helix transcriptional regulator